MVGESEMPPGRILSGSKDVSRVRKGLPRTGGFAGQNLKKQAIRLSL